LSIERSLAAARDGSFSALGQLLDHYRDYLLRVANDELQSSLAPKVAPSDIVQDTFLQAAKDFPRFGGQTEGELRAWLRQILIHNLKDTARRFQQTQKRATSMEVALGEEDRATAGAEDMECTLPLPGERLVSAERRSQIESLLDQLSHEHRQVIQLRTFEGRSFNEIAALMGRTSKAVQKLWSRAIRNLAREMKRHDSR
jgi:RNA polymerase sigma-70 factor (ECF subfamily)